MAQRKRRHSCFYLTALVVVEIDVIVDQCVGFNKGCRKMSVNALRFKNGEEIFCHCVVIAIPSS